VSRHSLFSLEGRIALVTGAAGWLGESMVVALAEHGAHVVMVGRRATALEESAVRLRSNGLSVEPCPLDIRDWEKTARTLERIRATYGRLDVLVNNASATPAGARGLDSPDESFAAATEIGLTAPWRLIREARGLLRAAVKDCGDASIINISSMYGKVSPVPSVYENTSQPPNPPFYGAAKAGVLQLTRWLACNLGPDRIRVNCISPGPFPQWNAMERTPDFVSALGERTPLGRTGERHEIRGAIVFLASQASTFVTGADIPVDGGWTAW
jgi:NAD(P)-dependent dehydrogenase (short-subunit alcohol dehydrogenase family)